MFLIPALLTLIVLVIEEVIFKHRKSWGRYVVMFFILLGIEFIFQPFSANACESISGKCVFLNQEISADQFKLPIPEMMSDKQKKEFIEKSRYHQREGNKQFNLAQETSLLIPDKDHKEIAKQLFQVAVVASVNYGQSWSSIIVVLVTGLAQYSLNVYDQWDKIETHLMASKMHYELMDWYKNAAENG